MNDKTFPLGNKRTLDVLGLSPETIGKTQARQNFFPLVDALVHRNAVVEITDHNDPVAVLVSYNHWLALLSKLAQYSKTDLSIKVPNLIGSIQIRGDLETGSKKAAVAFEDSIVKSAESL